MARILMIIAQNGFRDEELFDPMEVFEGYGYKVDVASQTTAPATGMLGGLVKPNLAIRDARVYEYDAVVVVGGKGSVALAGNPDVLRLVKDAYDRQKVVGAICLGPMALAKAGLLKGKKATVFQMPDSINMFRENGVEFVKQDVVAAGQIITADGPASAKKFAQKIHEMIL